jgi:hypothetical protein
MQNKMGDVNNNMDKVFREKLSDFRQQPPEEIWVGIKAGIGKKPRRKILIPLWQAAAGMALLITAGSIFYYLNLPSPNKMAEHIFVIPQTNQPANQSVKVDSSKTPAKSETAFASVNTSKKVLPENITHQVKPLIEPVFVSESNNSGEILSDQASPETSRRSESFTALSDEFMTSKFLMPVKQDKIPRNEKRIEASWDMLTASAEEYSDESKSFDRMVITAQVSPTYSYRDIGNIGAGGSEQFNQYESGKISYSGGMQFGYKTSERLSIHAGLMYAQLGYNVNQVASYRANNLATGTGVLSAPESSGSVYAANNSIGKINSSSANSYFVGTNATQNLDKSGIDYISSGIIPVAMDNETIGQYFQYLEIPFLLRYKILDRKLAVNLLGGVSTNILVGNHVSLTAGNQTSDIGTSKNIRNFNYMGNMGLGLDYNLRKNLFFTVEPQFKYFLNSINQSSLIANRPYMLGMFTGVRFVW